MHAVCQCFVAICLVACMSGAMLHDGWGTFGVTPQIQSRPTASRHYASHNRSLSPQCRMPAASIACSRTACLRCHSFRRARSSDGHSGVPPARFSQSTIAHNLSILFDVRVSWNPFVPLRLGVNHSRIGEPLAASERPRITGPHPQISRFFLSSLLTFTIFHLYSSSPPSSSSMAHLPSLLLISSLFFLFLFLMARHCLSSCALGSIGMT